MRKQLDYKCASCEIKSCDHVKKGSLEINKCALTMGESSKLRLLSLSLEPENLWCLIIIQVETDMCS